MGMFAFCRRRCRRVRRTTPRSSARAEQNWTRLVRRIKHTRRLQRYFGNIGLYLQTFSSDFRHQLRVLWPAPSGPPKARGIFRATTEFIGVARSKRKDGK